MDSAHGQCNGTQRAIGEAPTVGPLELHTSVQPQWLQLRCSRLEASVSRKPAFRLETKCCRPPLIQLCVVGCVGDEGHGALDWARGSVTSGVQCSSPASLLEARPPVPAGSPPPATISPSFLSAPHVLRGKMQTRRTSPDSLERRPRFTSCVSVFR